MHVEGCPSLPLRSLDPLPDWADPARMRRPVTLSMLPVMFAIAFAPGACGPSFLELAASEPGASRFPSGLILKTTRPGSGASPKANSIVKVNYEGRLTDGAIFDSSLQRNEPAKLPLDQTIPCWIEALQKMKVGEKARLVCPSGIAYGDVGKPPVVPGSATLIFDVELLEIVEQAN